ncbi:hypothetical protein EVAR_77837_1 [Eumeta japonica]|uniref:Uncharacterized protein n=1 Tax=Eumeta variegata TaxID=151549 RepID=A0A4C1TB44_EUMVA|nr:hypothetical protein EVAR_77837_1 [Eumeta japonica]
MLPEQTIVILMHWVMPFRHEDDGALNLATPSYDSADRRRARVRAQRHYTHASTGRLGASTPSTVSLALLCKNKLCNVSRYDPAMSDRDRREEEQTVDGRIYGHRVSVERQRNAQLRRRVPSVAGYPLDQSAPSQI